MAILFFDNLILIYPLYAVMFSDAGLSALQISSLFIVWSLTGFVLELPSGSLADKYSRKHVLLAATFLKILGFLCWLLSKTYFGFMLGFILWGAKTALTSGTKEAFVYDELNQADHLSAYAKIMGRMEAWSIAGVILASFAASVLAHSGYNLILVLSMVSVVLASLSIWLIPSSKSVKSTEETKYLEYLKTGTKEAFKKPLVLYLIMLMATVSGLSIVEEYFGLFFREDHYNNTHIALWIAIIYGMGALGGLLAHKLEDKKQSIELYLMAWAVLLFIATVAPRGLAPIVLGFYFMFSLGTYVLFNAFLQKELPDKTRATTTSVGGLSAEVLGIFSFGLISLGANHSGYGLGFQLITGLTILCTLLLGLFAKRHKLYR